MDASQMVGMVMLGQADEILNELERAVRDRRKKVETEKAHEDFDPGVTVRFTNSVRPKYLAGHEAKIVGWISAKSVKVSMVTGERRFPVGSEVRVPVAAGIMERVS